MDIFGWTNVSYLYNQKSKASKDNKKIMKYRSVHILTKTFLQNPYSTFLLEATC